MKFVLLVRVLKRWHYSGMELGSSCCKLSRTMIRTDGRELCWQDDNVDIWLDGLVATVIQQVVDKWMCARHRLIMCADMYRRIVYTVRNQ